MEKTPDNCELIVFTTFDSSFPLFNKEDESYQSMILINQKLRELQIPLITVTKQTEAEIADLRKTYQFEDALIVEYGSAVLVPFHSDRFKITDLTTDSDRKDRIQQLGCTHIEKSFNINPECYIPD